MFGRLDRSSDPRFEPVHVRPKYQLGQNFLSDPDALDQVVAAADLHGTETVVEVGAGTGLLTNRLKDVAAQVVAIELDRELVPELTERFAGDQNVTVQHGDILETDPGGFPDRYVVVANVPYYITSKIIRHFLESTHRPQALTVTIQHEVAERITAHPPKMSLLAVSVQLYGKPQIIGRISRQAFWPSPDVDSAILRVEPILDASAINTKLGNLSENHFFQVARAGFADKRKQLHNSLGRHLDLSHQEATTLLERVEIAPDRRAETLAVDEWVQLGHAYRDYRDRR